ncbi:MAG: radical SAM protein [Thermotogae bacterium]|nr:radical SAM protein [Thermotogota bacterium]
MGFKYVYGPVVSRRLGVSLGVSPIPFKTCNYSCVYCQLGRTLHFTNEREEFFKLDEILHEVYEAVQRYHKLDAITVVGEGEPTLYSKLGELLDALKKFRGVKRAVITNGSLLYREDVRREILDADIVLPSLDAWNDEMYRKINRPHPDLNFQNLVEGLQAFRESYSGQIWMEVMLVKGLNDSNEALKKIAELLEKIHPDRVYINAPVRAPAEPWVKIPSSERLKAAERILGGIGIAYLPESGYQFHEKELVEEFLGVVKRHPVTLKEFEKMVIRRGGSPREMLKVLLNKGVEIVRYGERKFLRYRSSG